MKTLICMSFLDLVLSSQKKEGILAFSDCLPKSVISNNIQHDLEIQPVSISHRACHWSAPILWNAAWACGLQFFRESMNPRSWTFSTGPYGHIVGIWIVRWHQLVAEKRSGNVNREVVFGVFFCLRKDKKSATKEHLTAANPSSTLARFSWSDGATERIKTWMMSPNCEATVACGGKDVRHVSPLGWLGSKKGDKDQSSRSIKWISGQEMTSIDNRWWRWWLAFKITANCRP